MVQRSPPIICICFENSPLHNVDFYICLCTECVLFLLVPNWPPTRLDSYRRGGGNWIHVKYPFSSVPLTQIINAEYIMSLLGEEEETHSRNKSKPGVSLTKQSWAVRLYWGRTFIQCSAAEGLKLHNCF